MLDKKYVYTKYTKYQELIRNDLNIRGNERICLK
jgi:hypothetical protein